MKTLIRATMQPQWSVLPIAPFEFATFDVPVRRVTRQRLVPIRVAIRRANTVLHAGPFKAKRGSIDPDQRTKVFLPSPSLQGHGWMSLQLRARPVDHSAALSPLQLHLNAPEFFTKEARAPEQIAPMSHKSY